MILFFYSFYFQLIQRDKMAYSNFHSISEHEIIALIVIIFKFFIRILLRWMSHTHLNLNKYLRLPTVLVQPIYL